MPDSVQCGAHFDFQVTGLTAQDRERARCTIARHAENLEDFHELVEMLDLTAAPTGRVV